MDFSALAVHCIRLRGNDLVDGFALCFNAKEPRAYSEPCGRQRPFVSRANQLPMLNRYAPRVWVFLRVVVNLKRAAFGIAARVLDRHGSVWWLQDRERAA